MRWYGPTKHDAHPHLKPREERMKTERMNLGALFTLAAAGMLVCADLAYAQAAPAEKQVIESPGDRPIALHRVGEKSSAVNLTVVGKEVSPGIFQVDPNAISDK